MKIFNITKKILKRKRGGFTSLAEIIAALLIASLLALTTIRIYTRANATADSIRGHIENNDQANLILQRISEDIDKIATPGTGAQLTLENKFSEGFNICRLTIESRIYDNKSEPVTFEKIVWQSIYDPVVDGLTIYRSHSGMTLEDKVLAKFETMMSAWEGRELFVPVISGVSYFKIDVPKPGDAGMESAGQMEQESILLSAEDIEAQEQWTQEQLPKAVRLCISFGEIIESPTGGYDVYQEDKIYRTVAIDRIRKLEYNFIKPDVPDINDINDIYDVNDLYDFNDAEDMNDSDFNDVPFNDERER